MELYILSEAPKTPLTTFFRSEQYNITLNQNQADTSRRKLRQNGPNFITLGKISEEDKIEIIQTGFQLNQEGKISWKKYYEGARESTLFEWKGYSIKYESIRRTKLYQSLKE